MSNPKAAMKNAAFAILGGDADHGFFNLPQRDVSGEGHRQRAEYNKNNTDSEESVACRRDCGYGLRLLVFLDHKVSRAG